MDNHESGNSIHDNYQLDFMKRVADSIAKIFGSSCETVVSDNNDPNNSIIHINNGHVTGRIIGSPVSEVGLKKIRSGDFGHDMVNYIVRTKEGQTIKSASIYYTDENCSYCLGINFDFTNIANVLSSLENLVQTNEEIQDDFSSNPYQILNNMFNQAIKTINRPINQFTREDKIKIVQTLDEMGAFLLRKGVTFIAEKLDISRYTVYNYIKAINRDEQK